MNLATILIILLVIFVVMGIPQFGVWQHNYGAWPSGLGGILLLVLLVLLLTGRL